MAFETIGKETLETLLALAESGDANACWGSDRAIELLRTHATAEELRTAGATEALIELVFGDGDGR